MLFGLVSRHYIDFVATAPAERKGEPIKAEPHKPAGGRMSLVDALQKAGFKCIDNRTTSSILWVLYEPARKELFENTIAGYSVQCKLEKRGALATNNAPAWRIMIY